MAVKCSNRTLWSTADEDGYPYWVEFEDRPFTKGNSKYMYKGRLNGKGPRSGEYCTLKVFKTIDIAKHEDWNPYVNRIEAANKLAAQFNKMMDNQYTVKFAVPTLALIDISSTCTDCIYFLSNTKRIRSDDCVAIEPYIGSKFRKFYRNSPLKGAECAYILQAFSHFTASQTGNTLVCGLQGVAHGTEFVLTNPIMHSANQEWGPKDQGAHGFRKFFSAHTCNDICRTMGLPDYLETMSVAEEIDQEAVDTSKTSLEVNELETSPKRFVSTDNIEAEITPQSLPQTEAQISDTSSYIKETPTILQTPPMSRVGRTISAPLSTGISLSRSSSVTGPPAFAEDLPGESISRPPTESVILDATPIDDIATHLSDTLDVLPPPSSEYRGPFTPCRTVSEYLELKKNYASFSPGSESIPMIDDELACAESEFMEAVPPPTDDFEPTISPSLSSYLKDKDSLEIIPHGSMDLDLESQQSISVFEDNLPAPHLGSMNNFQMSPRESVTHNAEMLESHTPCGTMSQESLVTTPCGTIHQEVDSQPSIVSTQDSVSQDLVPVSEPLIEASNYQLPVSSEIPQDIESQVCFVSIPPDCMDHHLDTVESFEALSPAGEKLTSGEEMAEPKSSLEEPGEECMESGTGDVAEEPIGMQEFPETQTVQEMGGDTFETYPLDNVEAGVQKSVSVDTISSDFKQSLETIPEGSNESDSAQSLDTSEMPTEVQGETTAVENNDGMVADNQTVVTTDTHFNGQEEASSGIQPGSTIEGPETGVTGETVTCETAASEGVIVEPTIETAGEEGANICEETPIEMSAEPVCEAPVSQETSVENNVEPESMATQEATVEPGAIDSQAQETTVETVGEDTTSQETNVGTVGEATTCQETNVDTVDETTTSQEPNVETIGEATTSQETNVETVGEATTSQDTNVETVGDATASQETNVETVGEATTAQETNVETVGEATTAQEANVETVGEATTSQEPNVETIGESTTSQETNVETIGESTTSQEANVETIDETTTSQEPNVETIGEATTSQETNVETVGEATTSQDTNVETVGDATASQETNVETVGEATTAQETNVETVGEATTAQEANVETVGEATTSQEPNVETIGESTTSQETNVETIGESTTSQEANVETIGEATTSEETNVETVGEATTSQEPNVETIGQATTSQETNVETVGEATTSQEPNVETVGEATASQETTVETSEPVAEGMSSQETTVEPVCESAVQETAVETAMESQYQEPAIEKTTADTTEECYGKQVVADTTVQHGYVCENTQMGETNVCQDTVRDINEEANICQQNPVDCTREADMNQETAVETVYQSCGFVYTAECTEGNAGQGSMVESTGDGYVCQNTWPESTAGETFACQETANGSAVGATGVCNAYENSGFGTTVGTIGEGYVCQDSAGETIVDGSKVTETTEGVCVNQDAGFEPAMQCYTNKNIDFESCVEPSADGYTSQDSGFGSVVDSNPTGYPNPEQSFTVTDNSNPGSNTYFQSFEGPTSSYPTGTMDDTSNQSTDPYYYGLPPEYRINEDCGLSQCEAGCPLRTTKMTIIPDLDSMEHVETKCLDSVCEEQDMQQGIETLPRRKISYYLEPQESHEIITFRINIAPEYPTLDGNPNRSLYQNAGAINQGSNTGESSPGSANYCSSCQAREIPSENVAETSTYSYHYSDTSHSTETMPQRSCGYSSDVHQNVPADWSYTHSVWDDSHCSTAQNQQTASGDKVYSKFSPNV